MLAEPPVNSPDYDELLMSLVESALSRSPRERESYLRNACSGNSGIFEDAWSYVLREQLMNGFLVKPLLPPVAETQLPQPGDLLHRRFRIVRKVAHGGMGVVYEAQDEKLGRRIAIKCAKSDFHERLPPEVRSASEIAHPNICKIFEIHTTSLGGAEFDFLTMEFLDGETLAERLRRGPLSSKEARIIGRQLCDGLEEAHRNQVIHADLKTANVILCKTADGGIRAVITDFGLAFRSVAARSKAETRQVAGTPSYMAPELLQGGKPSEASDLYALGVILYELAAGQKPIPADLSWEERLVQKAAPVNHPWNGILQRCLDPAPGRRPAGAAVVGRVIAPAASLRIPLLAAAALAVLAILLSVWLYSRVNAPEETVRLAVLPFEAGPDTGSLAAQLSGDVSAELAKLVRSRRTEVLAISAGAAQASGVNDAAKARRELRATHVIRASVSMEKENVVIRASLVDTDSMAKRKEWKGVYSRSETRFIPVALAGIVTGAFHLPSVKQFDTVNAAARKDYQLGLSYLRYDSSINAALPLLERAVAADPDSAMTHAALAEGQWWKFRETGDNAWRERAAGTVIEADRRNTDLAAVHSVAGLLMSAGGWREQAASEYLRAIELEPGNGDAFRRLGMVYDDLKEHDKALAAFRRAVELAPDYHRNHQALGNFWTNRADYQEAIRHFRRTVELAPVEPAAHFALAVAYVYEGQFYESEAELRTALALGETPKALNALGTTLLYLNRDQEAITYFTRALQQEPGRYLWWMNLGTAYRRLNMADAAAHANREALALVEGWLKNNPRDGYVRACLAYVCAWLGETGRARSEIAQALQLSPEDNWTRRMAVKTYEALKRREDTLAILRDSPAQVVADASRYPDLADLHRDSRFKTMLAEQITK